MSELVEIWKPVVGYEKFYEVSNLGRVRSLDRCFKTNNRWGEMNRVYKGKILVNHINPDGYHEIRLSENGKYKVFKVHRLMCAAFLPNPNNLPEVNHKNKKRDCNIIWVNEDGSIDYEKSNLEWCTRTNNNRDRNCVKEIVQYTMDGKILNIFKTTTDASKHICNKKGNNITMCLKGKTKYAYNSKWGYLDDQLADWLEEIQNE